MNVDEHGKDKLFLQGEEGFEKGGRNKFFAASTYPNCSWALKSLFFIACCELFTVSL